MTAFSFELHKIIIKFPKGYKRHVYVSLESQFSSGLCSAGGEWLDSMILEGLSNLNDSMVL